MKLMRRADREVFGISFLDVISCGFGAVLALVIMARNGEEVVDLDVPEQQVAVIRDRAQEKIIMNDVEMLTSELQRLDQQATGLESRLAATEAEAEMLSKSIITTARPVSPSVGQVGSIDSVYSGGIPVGREYIIFLIDTSGSMQKFWPIVTAKIKAIIDAHPKVKGLQVMNDNGQYLIEGYAARWIPDSQSARRRALDKLQTWSGFSSSSPAEGLEVALRTYARKGDAVSIYVVGDDFTGASYQAVIDTIDRWNVDPATGKHSATIHGIGFPWGLGTRFSTLMREVSNQNGGVFIAL